MTGRTIGATVTARLHQFPAVALIGPRQVGKTTLARWLAAAAADSVYLDLEDPVDLAKLDDASGYLRGLRRRLWAIEIRRGSVPKVEKGLRTAREDLQPDRTFLVHSRRERYPKGGGVEAIGLTALADTLARLRPAPGARRGGVRPGLLP